MNNTTRKHPRNLNEAFGPYCNRHINEPAMPYTWHDKLIIVSCIATVAYVIASRFF